MPKTTSSNSYEGGFGLAVMKGEGKPCHPDYCGIGFSPMEGSDEAYLRQLQAYADCYGLDALLQVGCVRDDLLQRVKRN